MQFTERSPLEQGFAPIFEDQVRPALMGLEEERIARLARARRWMVMVLAAAAVLAAGVLLIFQLATPAIIAALVIAVLGVIGMAAARAIQSSGWSGSVAEAIMPAICSHVGALEFDAKAVSGFPIGPMQSLGLVGSYDRARLTDRLTGRHRDTGFEMVEAYLTRKTRDSDGDSKTTTVFKGLLFRIGVPVPVPTDILITRDYGKIGNKLGSLFSGGKGRGMPRVEMDHAGFEEVFEVHANDPAAARDFMPPAFLDNLLNIGESEGRKGAKSMRAGFAGNSFWLALGRGGDFLAMGSLTRPVMDMEDDLHAIFADIEMVHRIIDRLHGAA